MADIFISYSHADRDKAKLFADAFAAQGWSVWWDPEIYVGTQYDKVIEEEHAKARCIVVLWSGRSVESRWVRSEASRAVERHALVPVRVDAAAAVPLEFTKIQTAELAGWDGDRDDPVFKNLAKGIDRLIGSSGTAAGPAFPRPAAPAPALPSPATKRGVPWRLGFLAAPTLVALILAVVAMQIHRPTAFDLDLLVDKVSFVSGGEQAALLLDKIPFASLDLHGIATGRIDAPRVEVVQEAEATPTIPRGGAAILLAVPVGISQRQATGAAFFFAASPGSAGSNVGDLDRVFLQAGGRAELAVTREAPPALSIRVPDEPAFRIVLTLRGEATAELVGAKIDTRTAESIDAGTLTLRVTAADGGSLVEMVGGAAGPAIRLIPSASAGSALSLASDLRLATLEFQTQGPTGAVATALSGDGTISYPEAPDRSKVGVKAGHYVAVRDLDGFFLRRVTFDPKAGALRVEAGGKARSLKSGPAGGVEERALTWFDSSWNQPRSVQLFGLALWLFPTTLAGYKLLKEFRQ